MNASEAAQVLTAAALVDKRTVGEADARMWAEILPETFGPRIAIEAVKTHYRESREMVMPADVIKQVEKVHARIRQRTELDIEAMRELPNSASKIAMIREFYEAAIGGANTSEANRRALDVARSLVSVPKQIEGNAA